MYVRIILCCVLSISVTAFPVDNQLHYFSRRWTSTFSTAEIQHQPKWRLIEGQPWDLSYQVREYNAGFWVASTSTCWSHKDADLKGYFNLYLYIRGLNENNIKYPLSYPMVTRVRTNLIGSLAPRRRRNIFSSSPCSAEYTAMTFLRDITDEEDIATPIDETISPKLLPQRLVYVREYVGSATGETCLQQKSQLVSSLLRDGVTFQHDEYFCVKYPSAPNRQPKYEVWVSGEMTPKDGKLEPSFHFE